MPRWIHGSAAQAASWRAAFDTAIGCPVRGLTVGGPDRVHPTTPGPGWTLHALEEPVDGPGNTGAVEVPEDLEHHLGQTHGPTTLPPQANAVQIGNLPPGLRTAAYARKGLDENGQPIPFLSAGGNPAETRLK